MITITKLITKTLWVENLENNEASKTIIKPEADIIFIASYPNNKGYGRKLLLYLFDDAKNNNVNSIKLDLHENNINAKRFYIKNGFKEIAVRKKYYDNKFNAFIMEKKLN